MAILSSLFNIGTDYPSAPPQGVAITQQKLAEEISPFYKDLLAKSQALFEDRTDEGFVPYTGPTMAPFTPQQEQAFTGIQSLVGTQAPQFQEATDLVRGTTQEFTPEVAQGLMSPFQQAVTDIEKREAQRDFEANVLPKVRQAQIAQGSFGGTRGSLLEAEALRNQQQQLADIQARGSLQAYQDAQNLFKDQAAREAAAAGQLATFAPAQYKASVGELGALQSVGEEQQRQQQSALDEAYRQFLEEKRFPEDTLGRYQATVQGFPALRQEISKVTPPQPSMANQLIGGLGTIGSLYGAYGGFSPGGFGSALPGYGPIKRASGGLVSLQQGDSVGRVMNDELMQQGNVAAQNRELDQMNQRMQLKTIEPELINRFVGEYYAKMNAADKSEEGLKSFLNEFGVGGTQRRMAEALDLPMLPAQSAPFRVDEEAMETGIPPAGMAPSYEELEDRYLTGAGYSPLERDTEESGGLSGALQRMKEMTFGRAQGGPVIRAAKGTQGGIPAALDTYLKGPMAMSLEQLINSPNTPGYNKQGDIRLLQIYDDLGNVKGGSQARAFLFNARPDLQKDFSEPGRFGYLKDRYRLIDKFTPGDLNKFSLSGLLQGGRNLAQAVATTDPTSEDYTSQIQDKSGVSFSGLNNIANRLKTLGTDIISGDDKKEEEVKQAAVVNQNEINNTLKLLQNQDKSLSGSDTTSATQKAIKKLSDLNKKVTNAENEVIDRIKDRDAKIAQKIQDSPEAIKTDLFALAAEKFTDLMQSTQPTTTAIAKGVGEFVKEGTGIGKEAQAGELDLENMAVDSMKDMATLRAGQFARGATEVAGLIDLANIEAKKGTLRRDLMAEGSKEFDKRFPRTGDLQGTTAQDARTLFQRVYALSNADPDLATQAVNQAFPNITPKQ